MKSIQQLQSKLIAIEARIERLEGKSVSQYTDRISNSFHLGMVGGSGRNNSRLNKIRSRELDRTINKAVEICALYKERDLLKNKIRYIEKAPDREIKTQSRNERLAAYWKGLKVGDLLETGNTNGNPVITKMNAKSCETSSGCKWTAAEIIGKDAAKLI